MTLTGRIVARALAVMALALGGVCLLTYQLVRVSGRDDLDRLLRDESSRLGATLAAEAGDTAGLDRVLVAPEAERAARTALAMHPSGPRHVAVITVETVRLQATGGPDELASLLRGDDAPAPQPGRLRTASTTAGPVRMLDLAATDPAGSTLAVITVASPLEPTLVAARVAMLRSAIAAAMAVAIGGAVLVVVVRRSLRPLRDLSEATRSVTPDDLTARVAVPATGDEVEHLARELNAMLERIDDDDRTRRRYLAAVSHEVRTPLTVAEGHLELLQRGQLDVAGGAATVRQELGRLRRVLDDLLSVARGDEVDIRPGPVFLPDLFEAIAARVDALGLSHRVRVGAAPPVAFTGDQARIEQCVSNLVANAVDHNPPSTTVEVTARAGTGEPGGAGGITITVTDDGDGIDPALLPRVREPFVTSRPTGSSRASGLGLTVVDTLTRAQGGSFELRSGPDGTTAVLHLPSEQPDGTRSDP